MKKIINYLLKKIKKTTKKTSLKPIGSFVNKTSKKFFSGDDSISFNGQQVLLKEEINLEAKVVLKEAIKNPDILVKFIKSKGTPVIESRSMNRILFLISEKEGFLPPMTGLKALVFSLLTNLASNTKLSISTKTPALFALDAKPLNIYFFSHQFHLWLSYINELPGFDEKTRENFKNIWECNADSMEISNLSIEEIISLKDAIARDLEAIKFVKEMARELVGQKQVHQKLQQGKQASL
jgi:hypothetical protein